MSEATNTLPPGYVLRGKLDLSKQLWLFLLLNLLGVVALLASGFIFVALARWLRPQAMAALFERMGQNIGVLEIGALLIGVMLIMVIIHEGIHGFFFWRFTGARPKYGIGLGYAYAAAPEWYLPRDQYMVVGLAPLVLMSLVGVALIAVLPAGWLGALLVLVIGNASGAVGDMAVVAWLLTLPRTALANDNGSAVSIYVPG